MPNRQPALCLRGVGPTRDDATPLMRGIPLSQVHLLAGPQVTDHSTLHPGLASNRHQRRMLDHVGRGWLGLRVQNLLRLCLNIFRLGTLFRKFLESFRRLLRGTLLGGRSLRIALARQLRRRGRAASLSGQGCDFLMPTPDPL